MSIETPSLPVSATISPSEPIHIVDGTAAAPSYSFTDDTDTGIFSTTDGTVSISVDGVEKVRVGETVQVGSWSADSSAALAINSTTGGLKPPRLTTTQRNLLTPSTGTFLFNTTSGEMEVWTGASWESLAGGGGGGLTYPLTAPDGSAGAPSYSFANSTGSGLFSSGVNVIDVATAGVSRLQVNAAGLVTVGNLDVTSLSSFPVGGSLDVSGGNLEVADSGVSDVKIVDVSASKLTGSFDADVVASADSTYDIGSNAVRWANVYADALDATSITGTLQTAAQPNITSLGTISSLDVSSVSSFPTNSSLTVSSGSLRVALMGVGTAELQNSSVIDTKISSVSASKLTGSFDADVVASADSTYDIGSNAVRWANIYADALDATSITGTLQTAAQPNITSLGTISSLTTTGTLTTHSIEPAADSTYDIGANAVRWANIYADALDATSITGTLQTAAQPNITSLGSLTSLTSGTIEPAADSTYDIGANAVRWANIYADALDATSITGTLQTAAQPNITSLGTISSLTTTGTLTTQTIEPSADSTYLLGNNSTRYLHGYFDNLTSSTVNAGDLSVTTLESDIIPGTNAAYDLGTSSGKFMNLYVYNVYSTSSVTTNSLNASAVSGMTIYGDLIPNADGARDLGSNSRRFTEAHAINFYGTLQTAAQPNITSLGSLTSLTSGTIEPTTDSTYNIGSNSTRWAHIYADAITTVTLNSTNLSGTLTTASQPNITSLGTLSSLSVGHITPSSDDTYDLGTNSLSWSNIYGEAIHIPDTDTTFSRPTADLIAENNVGDFVFFSNTPELRLIDKAASWGTSQIDLIMGRGSASSTSEYTSIRVEENSLTGYYVTTGSVSTFEWLHIDTVSSATPSANVGCGSQIFGSLTSGTKNTVFGTQCGNSFTDQKENSFFGHGAGKSSTAEYSAFFGNEAGASTTGDGNCGFGISTLSSTSGNDNCAVGYFAGNGITSGDFNLCMGTSSGAKIAGSSNNIAFGLSTLASGASNITGEGNIILGNYSGRYLAGAAQYNVFVGYGAGRAFGNGCLKNVMIGSDHLSVANGAIAFNSAVEGQHQINIGFDNMSHQQGDRNIMIGNDLGGSSMTSGVDNVIIGNSLQPSGNLSGCILISSSPNTDVYAYAGASNSVMIGRYQTTCYIRGIYQTVATASAVHVNSFGQLSRAASSLRYKKDVDYEARLAWRDKFLQLRPVQYHMKEGEQTWHFSFIAEDVDQIEPDWCVYDGDGLPDSLRFLEISCVTASVVQEHDAEIKDLQARIEALEAKLLSVNLPL
jgi:hypothetical protein